MIGTLAASMGLAATDPMFWMPLMLFAFVMFLLAGLVVLDGFDVGCGLLLPWSREASRARLLDALTGWRAPNEAWALLLFGVFIAGFPLGWVPVFDGLFLPILLFMTGAILRSVAFEFRARASMSAQTHWNRVYGLGAYASAAGLGLWLVHYAHISDSGVHGWLFNALVIFGVGANCVLLASCWVLTWGTDSERKQAANRGLMVIRWVAAALIAVSLVLMLSSPGIYYRWIHGTIGVTKLFVWWLWLLGLFVALELTLRRSRETNQPVRSLPLFLAALISVSFLLGLAFSYFPYLVLDEFTVWDAAAARESLRWVIAGLVVITPILLVSNVLGYVRLFRPRSVRETT
ncbi:cytochrome d ubiquinol oxidase subunit II [Orrella sp. 11846]|uniref:cytochrome d ubiquinol oxidase subunit II n=1 Tax=Orrella sp. 11846 TaxID=3409913 RepID=UPI003B5B3C50